MDLTLERLDQPRAAGSVLPLASLQANGRVVEVRFPRMGTFRPGEYAFTAFADPARNRAIIRRSDGALLDGEPDALPAGDGAAGGNFRFLIRID